MFARLALLFVVVPLVELALLIQVGQLIGLGPTILLVLATGFGGAALARREGLRTLASIQAELARGRVPGSALLDGAAILFGGALLLTPGVLTDFLGLSLLLPVTRRWFAGRLRAWFDRQLTAGRITVMTPGTGVFGGGGGFPFGAGPEARGGDANHHGLDPRHEIDGDSDQG